MPERMMLKGQLSEYKRQHRQLTVKLNGLILQIRILANPYLPDLAELKSEEILSAAQQVNDCLAELLQVRDKIKEMENDLGQL